MTDHDAKPQHLTALARANEIRLAQAELRRRIGALDQHDARQEVARLLEDVDECESAAWARMSIERLVIAIPRWGAHRALRLFRAAGIANPTRRVCDLTPRQRAAIAAVLRRPRAVLRPNAEDAAA